MSEGYSSRAFMCPFYRMNEKGVVICQAGEIGFENQKAHMSYVRKYCGHVSGWENCSLAQTLIREGKREEEDMEEMTVFKAKKALRELAEYDEYPPYKAIQMAIDALEFQQEAVNNNQFFGWLSVKTKLPEDLEQNKNKTSIYCMVSFKNFPRHPAHVEIRQRRKVKNKWEWSGKDTEHITHWRPRPNPVSK